MRRPTAPDSASRGPTGPAAPGPAGAAHCQHVYGPQEEKIQTADSQLLRAASRRRPQMSADAELMPCASHTRAVATARPLWCEHRMRERARIRKAKVCCALLDDCGSSEYDEYRVVLGSVWFREVGTRRYSISWSTGTRVRYSLSEYRAHRAILRAFRRSPPSTWKYAAYSGWS